MPLPAYRGRFAPSPTGPLHAGSLLAALGSWLLARQAGGEWLLRIEDLDPPREVAGAADGQRARTGGLRVAPRRPGHPSEPARRMYQEALDRLLAKGLAFECHCSRSDLAASGGIHRHCVAAARGPDPAIRLRVPDGARSASRTLVHGRVRQDVDARCRRLRAAPRRRLWAYQLAVVVDDAAQGITDVVRGADLLDSTPRQILLQRALGLPTPRYAHLPLVLDATAASCRSPRAALPVDVPTIRCPRCTRAWLALGQAPLPARRCDVDRTIPGGG
jgi:glutamyl-Q tRNA(Asp) synthetase